MHRNCLICIHDTNRHLWHPELGSFWRSGIDLPDVIRTLVSISQTTYNDICHTPVSKRKSFTLKPRSVKPYLHDGNSAWQGFWQLYHQNKYRTQGLNDNLSMYYVKWPKYMEALLSGYDKLHPRIWKTLAFNEGVKHIISWNCLETVGYPADRTFFSTRTTVLYDFN